MRLAVVAVLVTACSFRGLDGAMFDGRPDAEPSREDAPPGTLLWRMDTDVELATGATLDGTAVIARGVVEPEAFAVGMLRVRSSNTQEFTDPATVTWASLDALTPAATVLGGLPLDARARPGGVGLDADQTWTLWADGEIYLAAGGNAISLTATEHGFVDIALTPGAYTRYLSSSGTTESVTVTADAGGWYGIRLGLSTNDQVARFDFQLDPPGGAPAQPTYGGMFRTAANTMQGIAFLATDEPYIIRPAARTLHSDPALDEDWGSGGPDMGLIGFGNFGTRWEGQVRITIAGDYTFRITSDDGHRLWIGGALVSDQWLGGPRDDVIGPIALTEGWHDLVLDHCETGGTAALALRVETGPDLAGAPIPTTRLRPVVGPADRVIAAAMLSGLPRAPDTDLDLFLNAPPDAIPTFAELSVEVDHPAWSDVELRLTPPGAGAALIVVLDDEGDSRTGDDWAYATIPATPLWMTNGRWRMRFDDDSGANDGQALGYWLTLHYAGGGDTVRPSSTWTSPVHDWGRAQVIDNVMWSEFVPTTVSAATGITLAIRTCAAACTGEAWIDLPTSGSAPGTPAAQFVQVRATFSSNGTDAPWLDWVDVLARDP